MAPPSRAARCADGRRGGRGPEGTPHSGYARPAANRFWRTPRWFESSRPDPSSTRPGAVAAGPRPGHVARTKRGTRTRVAARRTPEVLERHPRAARQRLERPLADQHEGAAVATDRGHAPRSDETVTAHSPDPARGVKDPGYPGWLEADPAPPKTRRSKLGSRDDRRRERSEYSGEPSLGCAYVRAGRRSASAAQAIPWPTGADAADGVDTELDHDWMRVGRGSPVST